MHINDNLNTLTSCMTREKGKRNAEYKLSLEGSANDVTTRHDTTRQFMVITPSSYHPVMFSVPY